MGTKPKVRPGRAECLFAVWRSERAASHGPNALCSNIWAEGVDLPADWMERAGRGFSPSNEVTHVYSKKESAGIVPRHIPIRRTHNKQKENMDVLLLPQYMRFPPDIKQLFRFARLFPVVTAVSIIADFLLFASIKKRAVGILVDFRKAIDII